MDTSNIQETYPIGTCLDSLQRSLSSLEQEHGGLDSINLNGTVKLLIDLPYHSVGSN